MKGSSICKEPGMKGRAMENCHWSLVIGNRMGAWMHEISFFPIHQNPNTPIPHHPIIPSFHHSIIPGWKEKNARLEIPYYQAFLEIPLHLIMGCVR
jgi:hypothetical protein